MFTWKNMVKFLIFRLCHLPSYLFFCIFNDKLDDNKILSYILDILTTIDDSLKYILTRPIKIFFKILVFIVDIPAKLYNAIYEEPKVVIFKC